MGLYDYITDYFIECSFCGHRGAYAGGIIEIQTKGAGRNLSSFDVHYKNGNCCNSKLALVFDKTKHTKLTHLRKLDAIASCSSPSCSFISIMNQYVSNGYVGHRSRHFYITYDVDEEGRVIDTREINYDKINIIHLIDIFKDKVKNHKEFQATKTRYYNNFTLAVLMTNKWEDEKDGS